MKKIYYIIIAAMMAMGITSCTEMLEEESRTGIDKEKFMRNAKEAEVVLLGVYRIMTDNAAYGYHLSCLFTITSDIAQCNGNSAANFREVPANAHNANNSSVLSTWNTLYQGVYNATDFIERAEKNKETFNAADKALTEMYIGEAKLLRGLYYFELLRWFGSISLNKTMGDSYNDPSQIVQADPADVYTFIEQDLKDAALALPWSIDDDPRPSTQFRVSKGSALGLLAKVYATWAGYPVYDRDKWKLAAQTAGMVVESGKHALLPEFRQLWKNAANSIWSPQESLIEVSFYSPNDNKPAGYIGKWNGVTTDRIAGVRGSSVANVKVTYNFIEDWKAKNDPRYDLSIAEYKWVGKVKTPYTAKSPIEDPRNWQICTPAKWDIETYVEPANYIVSNSYSNVNWYVLRYADVLLLYAEALNEANSNPSPEAFEAVNKVRRRGFGVDINTPAPLVDLPSSLGYPEFSEAIRRERAYELCFEGGRRLDLVRWGVYYESIAATAQSLFNWYSTANFIAIQYTKKDKNEMLPIPQRELDLLPQYKPNLPGWGR